MILDLALIGTAGFLFFRGFYHAGALTNMLVQSAQPTPPAPEPPAPPPSTIEEERHEARLFLETGVWWLDPNRYGDDPHWRTRLGLVVETVNQAERTKRKLCPKCHTWDQVSVLSEHGGKATSWYCSRCDHDYTNAAKIDQMKNLMAQMRDVEAGLMSPAELRPPAVYDGVYASLPDSPYPWLPCGCSGFEATIEQHGPLKDGTRWTRCGKCRSWWEPRSDDSTGRTLAQGCYVQEKDAMNPTTRAVWERRRINGISSRDGVCPNFECQMPVERKKGGLYVCTSPACRNHTKGWR